MKATSANLLTLIKGPKQFVIPIYQRTYSWLIPQCNKLFNDILKVSRDSNNQGHFIGSVVYFQESIHAITDVPKLLVIDGQQRLTTVALIIAAVAEFIKNNKIEIDTSYTKLQNYYLLNSDEEGELQYKLLLTKRDKETLKSIIKGTPLPIDHSMRIAANFDFFKQKINKENILDVYNGVLRLFIVDVALEKDKDNPQLIFESMNSTGLDLSQADLIRNYVLMGQEINHQTILYEKYWFPMEQSYGNEYSNHFDWFVRDYISSKTGSIPTIGKVYEAFKQYVQNIHSPERVFQIVEDLNKYSQFYVNMVLRKESNTELKPLFNNILKLKVDVSYPFLLSVYKDYFEGVLSLQDFAEIIKLVESYVFRRAICGIPTNSLNKTFVTLYKFIIKEKYLESVKAAFLLLENYKRYPDNAEFEKELVVKDVYNFRSRNYLLSKLENYNRKEVVNVDEYTIEHIMPQNPKLNHKWQEMLGSTWQEIHKKYLHTIGNLTLTGYNPELSDNSFDVKKSIEGGFDNSPLKLNTFLRTNFIWNEDAIKTRAELLAKQATIIWLSPQLEQSVLESYKPVEEKSINIYAIENFDYLKGDVLELYNALRKRIMNIDASVREEFKKLYIAYKSSTNFVDVIPYKTKLMLSINVDADSVDDPLQLCMDVRNKGRWGNGEVEVAYSNVNELDDIMYLIQQAFEEQMEEV